MANINLLSNKFINFKIKIMKRIYIVLISLFLSLFSYADQITLETAKDAAISFINKKTDLNTDSSRTQLVYINQNNDVNYFYVFNFNDSGYVIVSGDDDVYPILGYSDEGIFTPEIENQALIKFLNNYKNQISYVIQNNVDATEDIENSWNTLLDKNNFRLNQSNNQFSIVEPLVSVKWDQGLYFNDQCPLDEENGLEYYGYRAVTGCPATAMAQIMKYWNYPEQGTGFKSYNHETYGTLSANFGGTYYNWNAMPTYVNNPNEAVAELMYHCGVAVEMQYGPALSGSYVIEDYTPSIEQTCENAYKTYFGYNPETLEGIIRSYTDQNGNLVENYSDSEWINLMKDELNNSRPIQYAGFGGGGGHTWVCDGYDSNDFFHMNWGWGGAHDGYFSLNSLNPSGLGIGGGTGGYNDTQQVLIGIQPMNIDQPEDEFDLRLYSEISISENPVGFTNDFNLAFDVANYGSLQFDGEIGAAIFDINGNFITFNQIQASTLPSLTYLSYDLNNQSGIILVPGSYYAQVYYRNSDVDWTSVSNGDYNNFIPFDINYSADIEINSNFSLVGNSEDNVYQGDDVTINVDIINTGQNTFFGSYRLLLSTLDGTPVQDIQILNENNGLPQNSSYGGVDFTGNVSAAPGTYLLILAYQYSGTDSWYYAGSTSFQNPVYVNVQAQPLAPDIYEPNNSVSTAYVFYPEFNNDTESYYIPSTNIHTGDDMDYYIFSLPDGFDYSLNANVFDSYNNENYSGDVMFSFSIDNGVTWSDVYDSVSNEELIISNGGNVYIHAAPALAGITGTYQLNINISRETLSLGDISYNDEIIIYPNPASEKINIKLKNDQLSYNNISIINSLGQVVKTQKSNSEIDVNIDVKDLPSGLYLLNINSDSSTSVKKLIIEK